MKSIDELLELVASGAIDQAQARAEIEAHFFQPMNETTIDHDRERRTGAPEVVYGGHKTADQIDAAMQAIVARGQNALATRVSDAAAHEIVSRRPECEHDPVAATLVAKIRTGPKAATSVAVVTAGTSDQRVAEEAAVTAEFYDNPVVRVNDVGVAGIHRLFNRIEDIRSSRVVIVVAGMEGALPSVVGGLVDKPVIAVPTSVGYGAAFGGLAALLGMLNSCASGVSVVNIDNGFGAGYLASMINQL